MFGFPQFAKAQLSCQQTVNKVVRQIRSKGVPQVKTYLYKNQANTHNTGNPTNRKDILLIVMYNSDRNNIFNVGKVQNVVNSGQLQNTWANSIVRSCGGTAVVAFTQDATDWLIEYAVQPNMSAKARQCVDSQPIFSWNEFYCPPGS